MPLRVALLQASSYQGRHDHRRRPGRQRGVLPRGRRPRRPAPGRHPRHRPDPGDPRPPHERSRRPRASGPPSSCARSAASRSPSSPTTAASPSPTPSSSATASTTTTTTATSPTSADLREPVGPSDARRRPMPATARPVKLALVTRRYPPLLGGAEKVLSYLAPALASGGGRGHGPDRPRAAGLAPRRRGRGARGAVDRGPPGDVAGAVRRDLALHEGARAAGSSGTAVDLAYVSMLKHDAYVAVGRGSGSGSRWCSGPRGRGRRATSPGRPGGGSAGAIGRRCREADAVVAISRAIADELAAAGYDPARIVEPAQRRPGARRALAAPARLARGPPRRLRRPARAREGPADARPTPGRSSAPSTRRPGSRSSARAPSGPPWRR